MQYRLSVLGALGLAGTSLAAYIPSEPWSTLTPDSPSPSGALTDYSHSFAIAIQPIATTSASLNKRAQVVSQIGDGQIQATTSTASTTKAKTTAQVVSQINDGQIQATTSTAKTTKAKTTAQVVSQIGDGQIQATTSTATKAKTTAQVVSQIGDGQIQATTATAKTTAQVVSQITDGQIQATTATETTAQAVSQITDGQIQATTTTDSDASASTGSSDEDDDVTAVACMTEGTLAMTLNSSILTDSAGRIGSIVANRQFQFDGPPPQAGAIYAAGWSITEDGNLAIGNNSEFYQCSSGNFYNLYDESIGAQCTPVYLQVVELEDC